MHGEIRSVVHGNAMAGKCNGGAEEKVQRCIQNNETLSLLGYI